MTEKPRPYWYHHAFGAIIALLGILTAAAAFQANRAAGNVAQHYATAQIDLARAQRLRSRADQLVSTDVQLIADIRLHEALGTDLDTLEVLFEQLSEEGQRAYQRSGRLDDAYQAAYYAESNLLEDNAGGAFTAAQAWEARGNRFELIVLILAVGLGFIGWGSLLPDDNPNRDTFAIVAVFILLGGAILFLIAILRPAPPIVLPL